MEPFVPLGAIGSSPMLGGGPPNDPNFEESITPRFSGRNLVFFINSKIAASIILNRFKISRFVVKAK